MSRVESKKIQKKKPSKVGGPYRDMYFDEYCVYIERLTREERIAMGKNPYKESTIRTIATDTFYIEKRDSRPFINWLRSDKTLEEANMHLIKHLCTRKDPNTDAKYYLECMCKFRDFLKDKGVLNDDLK